MVKGIWPTQGIGTFLLKVLSIVAMQFESCCGTWNVGTRLVTEGSTGGRSTVSVLVLMIEIDGVEMVLAG